MNGIRPQEVLDLWRTLEEYALEFPDQKELVLATVVSLDRSVYSRAGAMALFVAGPSPEGTIPAQSLQKSLYLNIEAVAKTRRPALVTLEIGEDDPLLGYGFCAAGTVEILLEPVTPTVREQLRQVRDSLLRAEGVVCSLEIEGAVGRRILLKPDHPEARECYAEGGPELIERAVKGVATRVFMCPIHPMGKVIIAGSGPDAACLAERLTDLGFAVVVADPRPGRLRNLNWDRVRARRVEGGWSEAAQAAVPDEETFVVVMSHGLDTDAEFLRGAFESPACYVGLAGAARRAHQLQARLEKEGVRPRPGVFCAPAGLDIGAETPEEAALSVAGEVLAARSGRKGRRLSSRVRGHAGFPLSPKAKIPGLILAAGRGRRFGAGHKLSALIDGKPVLRHVVENALASRLDPVIVVLGCEAEATLRLLQGLEDPRLRVVFNPLWASGKATSIEVALREAPASALGAVALLGDMPLVKPWLIERVLTEFMLTGRLVFPVIAGPNGPRKGYPTAFPRSLFEEIKALTGDDTAMEAARSHWSEAVKVPLEDEASQLDVDRPEDLELA